MGNKRLEQIVKLKNAKSTLAKAKRLTAKSDISIYGIDGQYFDSESEIATYCYTIDKSLDESVKLDYLKEFEGKNDVIRKTQSDGTINLYSALDEDGYYSYETSVKDGIPCFAWKYEFGNLRDIYDAFRNKGIVFENDVYAKISKKYKRIAEMAR